MKPVGFARNLSRLASSQLMSALFIAGEKSKPGTAPLLLPTMLASEGPILFSPDVVAWHAAQRAENTAWPAEGSPAANNVDELPSTAMNASPALRIDGLIRKSDF